MHSRFFYVVILPNDQYKHSTSQKTKGTHKQEVLNRNHLLKKKKKIEITSEVKASLYPMQNRYTETLLVAKIL